MEYTVTYSWNETKKPRNAYDVLLLVSNVTLINTFTLREKRISFMPFTPPSYL